MRRQWNTILTPPDEGAEPVAGALALTSSRDWMQMCIDVFDALVGGDPAYIGVERFKIDPVTGERVESRESAGNFVTLGYNVTIGEGEPFRLDREGEGSPEAAGFAAALAAVASPGFIVSMHQVKSALDLFGGDIHFLPYVDDRSGQVLAVAYHYEYVPAGHKPSLAKPIMLELAEEGAEPDPDEPGEDAGPVEDVPDADAE